MAGKIAAISGGAGDAIYAVGIMHQLGVDTLFVKHNFYPPPYEDQARALKPLMALQGIKVIPTDPNYGYWAYDPKIKYDYDLDLARCQQRRGRVHIIRNFIRQFGIEYNWRDPWLKLDDDHATPGERYTLISLSSRWREDSRVNWKRIRNRLTGRVCFIGFPDDHKDFVAKYGDVEYIFTKDFLEVARVIRDADVLYCNQGPALVIAQGIGQRYYLELKPHRTNTRLWTKQEKILIS